MMTPRPLSRAQLSKTFAFAGFDVIVVAGHFAGGKQVLAEIIE